MALTKIAEITPALQHSQRNTIKVEMIEETVSFKILSSEYQQLVVSISLFDYVVLR